MASSRWCRVCVDKLPKDSYCMTHTTDAEGHMYTCPRACDLAADATPVFDEAGADSAATAFLKDMADLMPSLAANIWGADDVVLYMPGMAAYSHASWPHWEGTVNTIKPNSATYDASCGGNSLDGLGEPYRGLNFVPVEPAHQCAIAAAAHGPVLSGTPHYMSWVSKKLRQPILTGFKTWPLNAAFKPTVELSRPWGGNSDLFQACPISHVDNNTFSQTHLDRGHLVSASEMNTYAEGISSFSMCNIGTQTPAMNQMDWLNLETLTNCMARRAVFYEFSGPLFANVRPEFNVDTLYCACDNAAAAGTVCSCDTAASGAVLCAACTNKLPVAQGWWKLLVFRNGISGKSGMESFLWFFTTAQEGCLANQGGPGGAVKCQGIGTSGVVADLCKSPRPLAAESTCEAYCSCRGAFQQLEMQGIYFPEAIMEALQPSCTAVNALAASGCPKDVLAFCADTGGNTVNQNMFNFYNNPMKYDANLACLNPNVTSKMCCRSSCAGKAAGVSDGCGRRCSGDGELYCMNENLTPPGCVTCTNAKLNFADNCITCLNPLLQTPACTKCINKKLDPNTRCTTCSNNPRLDTSTGCTDCLPIYTDPLTACKTCKDPSKVFPAC